MKVARVMRSVHLYTGMFLLPWLLVYGTSAFFLNHMGLFQETTKAKNTFELLYEKEFEPDDTFPHAPPEQARAIVHFLGLDGPCQVRGRPTRRRMVIFRPSAGGHYRIVWNRVQSRITVERQPFYFWRLLTYLHFRAGYKSEFLALDLWALMVDLLAVSIWLWAISGVYLWASRGGKKRWGALSLAGGCALFAVLACILAH